MNLKAIITTLVLGTSSVALAAPYDKPAPAVRDHRMLPPRAPIAATWSVLATGHLVRGREVLAIRATKIDKLKLELVGPGRLFVDKLVVTFGNGRTQVIEVDRWLTARSGGAAAVVDLAGKGRRVTSIAVVGRGDGRGFRAGASFRLLAL